jgi:diguanylate cyclase (GGDEF)-like protein
MTISTERVAATGLAAAALAMVALAMLVFVDVARETDLNRSSMAQQGVQDSLERLRAEMLKAGQASYGFALTGRQSLHGDFDRASAEMTSELDYLKGQNFQDPGLQSAIAEVATRARTHLLFAGSLMDVRQEKGVQAALALGQQPEMERVEQEALSAVQDALRRQNASLGAMALEQIRLGEGLRRSVMWLVAGAIAFLAGVFLVYLYARIRQREIEARILFLAHHDALTQLPNRNLLSDRLAQQLAHSARSAGEFSVVAFDLDGFKGVNDTLGHAAGDQLLEQVANRARHAMRASDTVGRLGGDEFLAILPDTGCEGAQALCRKLLADLAQPYRLGTETVRVSASAGIACHPVHGREEESLLRAADAALYEAKSAGKNRFAVVSETSFASARSA